MIAIAETRNRLNILVLGSVNTLGSSAKSTGTWHILDAPTLLQSLSIQRLLQTVQVHSKGRHICF